MEKNRNEWVIHIWGKKRDEIKLTNVEKFHIDMLKMYQEQQKKFDKILINIALDDIADKKLFNFIKKEISKVIVNDNVEFKYCQNYSNLGEYVTFRPYVFDRIGENVNIFYSHFKGYGSYVSVLRESYPIRVIDLCEMFWSYIMYSYSMNFDDVQEKFNNGMSVYCWLILKNKFENLDKILDSYYINYQKYVQDVIPDIKEYIEDDLCKHSPGSFIWYNMKNIGNSLKDKQLVTSIPSGETIEKSNMCTHLCELYLMQFLKESECYSYNNYNDEWKKMKNKLYMCLYPSKLIARELLDDFEKYLIDSEMI